MEIVMARKKSFNLPQGEEPLEFDLLGKTFHCRPSMAAGVIMRFADVMGGDEDEMNARASVRMMKEFFQTAIIAVDFDEFWALIEDPDIAIPVETLAEIANWLAGEYTDRPTGAPSSPGRDSGSSGGALTGVVYSREPTSLPSTPTEPST